MPLRSTVLYLVRHGAIVCSSEKRFVGQIDLPLSEEGVEQAWALRQWLKPVHFSQVFSSDLWRARRTCRIVSRSRANAVVTLPALREIDLGEWEGFTFREIKQRFPEEFAARGRDIENWRPPGGESFADCHVRVMSVLEGILARSQGNILLVGHAGINRLILCELLGIPIANLHRIGQDYGCLNVIDYSGRRARLELLNFTPPCPADRADYGEAGALCAGEMEKGNQYGSLVPRQ